MNAGDTTYPGKHIVSQSHRDRRVVTETHQHGYQIWPQNVLNLIWKFPGFVPFGANLTHFGAKSGNREIQLSLRHVIPELFFQQNKFTFSKWKKIVNMLLVLNTRSLAMSAWITYKRNKSSGTTVHSAVQSPHKKQFWNLQVYVYYWNSFIHSSTEHCPARSWRESHKPL